MNDHADYIAETSGSLQIAIAYSRRIQMQCERIGLAPLGGTRRDDLLEGLHSIPFERLALVLYRVADDGIWITNIIRRGRDVEALFDPD